MLASSSSKLWDRLDITITGLDRTFRLNKDVRIST